MQKSECTSVSILTRQKSLCNDWTAPLHTDAWCYSWIMSRCSYKDILHAWDELEVTSEKLVPLQVTSGLCPRMLIQNNYTYLLRTWIVRFHIIIVLLLQFCCYSNWFIHSFSLSIPYFNWPCICDSKVVTIGQVKSLMACMVALYTCTAHFYVKS